MSFLSVALKPIAYLSLPLIILHHVSSHSPVARYYIRIALYLSTLSACSAWGILVSIFMSIAGRRLDINYVVARSFYILAGRALGINFQVEGEEHFDEARPAVLVGNHQSMLDILYLGRIFPKQASMLAKKELMWSPLLGQYMLLSGAVFLDRANNKDAVQSLTKAGHAMKEQGASLWIFPEGTRTSQEYSTMLPFKKGAFHLAIQAGVPIVPVVCENYWRLYRQGVFESGTLRLRVLPPIATTGLTAADVLPLANQTRDLMLKALRDISPPSTWQPQPQPLELQVSQASQTPTPKEASREPEAESQQSAVEPSAGGVVGLGQGSETSSISGEQTEEDEGMIIVGRPER